MARVDEVVDGTLLQSLCCWIQDYTPIALLAYPVISSSLTHLGYSNVR
jgi:hypothetical protein